MTGNLARDHYPALPEVDRDIFALPSLTGTVPNEVPAGLGKLAAAPPMPRQSVL
jgi:hypothetical protein